VRKDDCAATLVMTDRIASVVLCLGLMASAAARTPISTEPQPGAATPSGAVSTLPTYTADGKMLYPGRFREWIFLTSGLDMSYSEKADSDMHSMFDNVFVNPQAYDVFKRTGTWPDHTVIVLEVRAAASKGSINKHGNFQSGDPLDVEVHVKDAKRFAGGWAFFGFEGTQPAKQIPVSESCYLCHQQHAAVDTTFVQFYPTLLSIAKDKGTLAPGYIP
jgi:hypothetical protein